MHVIAFVFAMFPVYGSPSRSCTVWSFSCWGFRCTFGSGMKILDWLVGYRKDWLRPDIIAGLITAAVVIPKAMAYATVAGLPVQAGLYTAFVPLVIYAVLGSSRVLSVTHHDDDRDPHGGQPRPGGARRRTRLCCCAPRPR